ncbi:MAG TPA: alanine dehydrogenase [Bacteroidia bacterium]|nr:alanine dehydrogenase [Bacteroidia bacterium]
MKTSKELQQSLSREAIPQEEMLEVGKKKGSLLIGIPKEISSQENRISLVPDDVALLVNNGHQIMIETGAGKNAHFEDSDYSEAGAQIVYSPEDVYKADIILKVTPPLLHETNMLNMSQTLISALQLTVQPKDFLRHLMLKKINAIAFDWLQDESGIFPVIRSMSEIVGGTSISIAEEYLSNVHNGPGLLMGGVSGIAPTEVIILGAGTVGEFATRAALGRGAIVKVFDNSIYRLRRLQTMVGARVFTSTIRPRVLARHLKSADVVIGAIRSTGGRTPCVVTEEMVSDMKVGSVIVDVSIDQGGCFETSRVTSHNDPVFRKHGVTHYCVPNIASRVARTASIAFSNIFTPILLRVGDEGGMDNLIKQDQQIRNGVYIYKGMLTNKYLGEQFKIPYKDLGLLLMTRQ